MSSEDPVQRLCEALRQLNLSEATKVIEDAARKLLEMKDITPSSLERLAELLKREISDEVDLIEIRSEVLKLSLPNISICIADVLKKVDLGSKELIKLRKLIEALINFYKYYDSVRA